MNHGAHGGHGELRDGDDLLVAAVLTAAMDVHRTFGPGLLESLRLQRGDFLNFDKRLLQEGIKRVSI